PKRTRHHGPARSAWITMPAATALPSIHSNDPDRPVLGARSRAPRTSLPLMTRRDPLSAVGELVEVLYFPLMRICRCITDPRTAGGRTVRRYCRAAIAALFIAASLP